MELSMKGSGKKVNTMVKVSCKQVMEKFTPAILRMVNSMDDTC